MAKFIEKTFEQNLAPYYTLIAEHYKFGEQKKKAVDYFVRAGEQGWYF